MVDEIVFYKKQLTTFGVTEPTELPDDQKHFLTKHLEYSSALKEMHCRGEAIVHGLFTFKKPKGKIKVIKNQQIRSLIRCIRRFTKYELLRSSLEGLMFEQVPYLDEPVEKHFKIAGVQQPLLMTHVYFSRSFWEFYTYEQEAIFDRSQDLTEGDMMFILGFLNNLEALLWSIKRFSDDYNGRDRLKWRQRLRSNIRSIMKAQTTIKLMLLDVVKVILMNEL
jgi:hypothetical protein